MTNHWAIAVGINQYQSLQPLNFAQQDAQKLCETLVSEAGFLPENCILLTDNSPEVLGRSTYPSRDNLQHWIRFFKQELAHTEDWVWIFFNGYGVCDNGTDYLMPIEGNPAEPEKTGVSVRSLFEQLRELPTDRLLVLLDINRSQSLTTGDKLGTQTANLAREFNIPTLLSCRPEEFSHEDSALQSGLFTAAIVEGLRSHQCSTLSSLEDFLNGRLPELCDHNAHPIQHPVLMVTDPDQVYQVITPVNWAETEPWKPAPNTSANPFTIENDFFDTSIIDSDPVIVATVNSDSIPTADREFSSSTLLLDTQGDPVFPSDEPRSPTVKLAPEPIASADSELPNQVFWEKILFGGGALLLLLLLGVLFRNWNAFMGQPSPEVAQTARPASPVATKSPIAGAKPGTTPIQPPTSQELLAQARSAIKPARPGDAVNAINAARKIPANDPLYPEAQQDIDRWSRNILDIAKQRAQQREFKQAIAAAQLVPKDRAPIYAEAQKAIEQWKKGRP